MAVSCETRVSSERIASKFSCARLLSVISIIVPMNISGPDGEARATEACAHITVPSLRRYCLSTA